MKILVLSDSHSSLRFMRSCIEILKPDAGVHLGDHYDDGEVIAQENPGLTVYQVAGNCDKYRAPDHACELLVCSVGGVKMFMTHGHRYGVKSGEEALLAAARAQNADVVLYGHTHTQVCRREGDGLWVLNPGSCGYSDAGAGLIEIKEGRITACRLVRQADLEEKQNFI